MNNNKTNPAIIHATYGIGSTFAAPYYDINIQQLLCSCACADERPVFDPKFSVQSVENVGPSQYLIYLHVEGVISYIPCHCGSCCTRTQLLSQDFTIPIFTAAAPTAVTATAGAPRNSIIRNACNPCSRAFECDVPLTLTITTA